MKFVRFLCNLGLLIATYFMIFAIGVLAYSAVSWSISSDEAIHFASSDHNKVNFYDLWSFQGTDIAVNIGSEPKPYVRNIFGGNGKWADYAINFVTGLAKPIIIPQAQIDNIAENRTASIYEDLLGDYSGVYPNHLKSLNNKYLKDVDNYGAFVELATFKMENRNRNLGLSVNGETGIEFKIDGWVPVEETKEPIEIPYMTITPMSGNVINVYFKGTVEKELDADGNQVEKDGVLVFKANIDYSTIYIYKEVIDEYGEKVNKSVGDGKYAFFTEEKVGGYTAARNATLFDATYQNWAIRRNDALANRMWLSYKYWNPKFDNYLQKFAKHGIHNELLFDGNGKPIIKTEVVMLCVIQWVALILAIIFTIKYPVSLIQARIESRRQRRKAAGSDGSVTL